jgi:hypothetical protein
MAHPDIYVPRQGSGIQVKQIVGELTHIRHVNGPRDPVDQAVQEIGREVGDTIGRIFGSPTPDPGPDGIREEALLQVSLPSNASISLDATVDNIVTSPDGIDRPGVLLFMRELPRGNWDGPFNPHHTYGYAWFEHPGHTGITGGDVVIQAAIKNWSDANAYEFLMKVFYTLR